MSTSTFRGAAVSASLVLLVAAPLGARRDTVFHEEIDVGLVEIEVVVTDARGEPVTGLERQDFELRQGRKKVEATHFSAFVDGIRREAVDGAGDTPEIPWTVDDRLNLVLYLDFAYMEAGELADVVDAVRGFLRRALRAKDRVLLVEANHSLTVRRPFTTLPELIDDELRRLEPPAPRGRAAGEVPRLLQEIERVAQRGADVPGLSRTERPMMLKAEIDTLVGQIHHELSQATHQLHRLIPALAGLPGRTEILYVGGSLPANAGQRLYGAWHTAFGASSVYQRQRTSDGNDDDFGRLLNTAAEAAAHEGDANELFRRVADLANANGVTFHALDTGGLRRSRAFIAARSTVMTETSPGANYGERPDSSLRLGNPRIFEMMAEATGGRALIHSRDFAAELDAVARELRTYYVLAFPPPEGSGIHDVRVRLRGKHRGLTVRHRRAYRVPDPDRDAARKAVSALILGEVRNPHRFAVAAAAPEPVEGKKFLVRLPLSVVFPLATLQLIRDGREHRGQVSIFLTSGDLESGAAQVQKAVVPLAFADGELADALERNVEYKLELPMTAGSRKVAVALRDDLRPLTSTVVLDLLSPSR